MQPRHATATAVTSVVVLFVAAPVHGENGPAFGDRPVLGDGRTSVGEPPRPAEIVVQDESFDWGDASVGAAASLGAACLAAGALLSIRSTRPDHIGVSRERRTER